MPNKNRIFIDKPEKDAYGRYLFLSNNNQSEHNYSNGVPRAWDKFTDKDLYTTHKDHPINLPIVQSMVDYNNNPDFDYLRYAQDTFFRIDELVLMRRPGAKYGFKDRRVKLFIFSNYGTPIDPDNAYNSNDDDTPYRTPFVMSGVNVTSELKTWWDYRLDLYRTGNAHHLDAGEIGMLMHKNINGVGQDADPGPVGELNNYTFMTNLNAIQTVDDDEAVGGGIPNGDYPAFENNGLLVAGGYFNPTSHEAYFNHKNIPEELDLNQYIGAFNKIPSIDDPLLGGPEEGSDSNDRSRSPDITAVFQEDGQYNPIWIVVDHKADTSIPGGGNDRRNNDRIEIFKIDPHNLFTYTSAGDIIGKETSFEFGLNDSLIMDETNSSQYAPNQTISSLKVTINTFGSDLGTLAPEYQDFLTEVTAPQPRVDLLDLDERFLNLNPTNEIFYTSRFGITNNVSLFSDWTPISTVKTTDSQHELQAYYENENDRIKSSTPNTIILNFTVGDDRENFDNGGEIVDRSTTLPESLKIGYAFFVVSWNDIENEFEHWENVMTSYPRNFNQLIDNQNNNLYKTGIANRTSLRHSYSTPGMKTIKVIMFNYELSENNPNLAEPIRWKLVTVRHFCDIPKNSYPDFGELGGDDYVTIPWPYTTPVIGGVSKDSKYMNTINKVLYGGKIGNNEIIDEKFLLEAIENTELGQNIEKVDIEQVRFFNNGEFDMHRLLNINTVNDIFTNDIDHPYDNFTYWDGNTTERNYGQNIVEEIFIDDITDYYVKSYCVLELNTGQLLGKSIDDSSGNGHKGLLIGDYKIKKTQKGKPMRRDSFIKISKRDTTDGAL